MSFRSPVLVVLFLTGSLLLAGSCGGGGGGGSIPYGGEELTVYLRNDTSGVFTHGTLRVLETGQTWEILGTPEDDDVIEPNTWSRIGYVPWGWSIDVYVEGYDAAAGTPRAWAQTNVLVYTPVPTSSVFVSMPGP